MWKSVKLAKRVAVLVDGAFFIKRYQALYSDWENKGPRGIVRSLRAGILADLRKINGSTGFEIYRIFYYDCPPLNKRLQNPITRKRLRVTTADKTRFSLALFAELRKTRKVALRLGALSNDGAWIIKPEVVQNLIDGKVATQDLNGDSVRYDLPQKSVSMMIGLDTAWLAFKEQVEQILLISGDSDFVPAAKLARREGINFILDPMGNPIKPDLEEHVDGLQSCWDKLGS
ncbi:MAG: NYN domain-containing protein [Cellvibrionales bacterium]|nr:NYN domain-containing protein [Cellvibrionales bacterium]